MTRPPSLLQLTGHTHAPRHKVLPATNDALNECGALLEDLHDYSNRMTTYRFEIARSEVARLAQALINAKIVLEGHDRDQSDLRTDADGFVRATLQLTFVAEDGNRRNPNPDLG